MCREPHQDSGPIGKALFQAEVTQQGTVHNSMSPARQPTGLIGHIPCHILQTSSRRDTYNMGSLREQGDKDRLRCIIAQFGTLSVV